MNVVSTRNPRTLPNHLADVLRACRELNTTETKALAARLELSPASVNAYFQRISDLLETTDRFQSVQQAYKLGLLFQTEDNLLVNGDFTEGHRGDSPGSSLPWTTVVGWSALGRSTPQWVTPATDGGPGAVMMWGAADTGEAIWQSLPLARRLRAGKVYRISAEYRFGPVRRDWPVVSTQPMFVDFVVRASVGPLPAYTTPDAPGEVATLGRFHYESRAPDGVQALSSKTTPEMLEALRRTGGEHSVREALYTERVGGYHTWAWEWGALEGWVSTGEFDTLTIHPTNDVVVRTDGTNPDAPFELAWGQLRRVRLAEVTAAASEAGP